VQVHLNFGPQQRAIELLGGAGVLLSTIPGGHDVATRLRPYEGVIVSVA
jgi:hypothetical protein